MKHFYTNLSRICYLCHYVVVLLSLTCVFAATTFCPSAPPPDSSLCCPQAPSKRGTEGWDRDRKGSTVYFHLGWEWGGGPGGGLDYHISAS